MENTNHISTILDVSKAVGFGLLYNPIIGRVAPTQFPFISRLKNKKRLVKTLPKC